MTADAGSGLVDYHGEVMRFLEANRGVPFKKETMDAYATDPHISSTVLEALLEDLTSRADSESDAALVEARIIIKTLGMPAFWRGPSKHAQRICNINVEPRSQLRIQRWTAELISRLALRESMLFVILDTIDVAPYPRFGRILPLKKSPIPLISNAAAPHAYGSRGTVGIASRVRAGSVPTGYLHPELQAPHLLDDCDVAVRHWTVRKLADELSGIRTRYALQSLRIRGRLESLLSSCPGAKRALSTYTDTRYVLKARMIQVA
ncbi:hypothetical protein B0H10DRAFT_1954995 [Mycena sp. CBHHK59/15]|nr:hypothetical protein B0H10DRAFT_1954995 [Mycena sp. CBHHK59/15]